MFEVLTKKIIRALLFFLFFVFLLTAGINTYLATSGIKEKTVLKAQEIFEKQLCVGFVYFLPWSGLHVESVTITDPKTPLTLRGSSLSFGTLGILRICKNSADWKGELRIKKILVNNRPLLKKIVAEVSRKNNIFSINPLIANIFGGRIQGAFILQKNNQASSPYQGNFSFLNIPLKELLSGTFFQQKVSAGFVQGSARFTGTTEKPESFDGSGSVEILGTEVKTADIFGTWSHLFPMKELQLLKLHEAKANYTFSSNSLHVDSARFQSDNIAIEAHGNISLKGEVDLESQLVLNRKLANDVTSVLGSDLTSAVAQRDFYKIPFKIHGSISNLQSNFLENSFNQQMPTNIIRFLQGVTQ